VRDDWDFWLPAVIGFVTLIGCFMLLAKMLV